jgi:biotin-dependent carboxylase-like uncharacterized protein
MSTRSIEVVRAIGVAIVEDAGRLHRLRDAIPRGGALDPESLAIANAAVGNAPGAAAIERYGSVAIRAHTDVVLADERGDVVVLEAGATARFDSDGSRRVGYVAIDGGIRVAPFLGGAGTLLSIGRGGHDGRPLRRGDVLALGVPSDRGARLAPVDDAGPIRVAPGPDLDRMSPDALDVLLGHAWGLDVRSDRMGTRLVGPTLAHRSGAPAITTPMIEGAIECPPGAPPIVLGPEHPTTGGYPVVAVITAADLARFHRTPLGRAISFTRSSTCS